MTERVGLEVDTLTIRIPIRLRPTRWTRAASARSSEETDAAIVAPSTSDGTGAAVRP
jgi:hypothetical protein